MDDDDFDATISDDVKTAIRALQYVRTKDAQKKNEETISNEEMISSVASDIKSSLGEFKSEVEKESFDKDLSESSKEYQSLLKTEFAKFQEVYEKFSKEKAAYLQALNDVISKYEEEKEKLFVRYEQPRKKREKALLSEYEKANAARIAQLEESLKKEKQVNLISYTLHHMDKTLSTNFQNCSGKKKEMNCSTGGNPRRRRKQDDKTFSILRKNEEMISSVASDIKSSLDELKSKLEKERQSFAEALSKSSKECENLLKTEAAKFQEVCEKFSKEKAACLQVVEDVILSKYKEESRRLYVRYDQLRKNEEDLLSEHEKTNAARTAQLEESLKKKKRDDKIFSTLTKTISWKCSR